jgi:hypothetical protein
MANDEGGATLWKRESLLPSHILAYLFPLPRLPTTLQPLCYAHSFAATIAFLYWTCLVTTLASVPSHFIPSTNMEFEVSYTLDDEQQFWDGLLFSPKPSTRSATQTNEPTNHLSPACAQNLTISFLRTARHNCSLTMPSSRIYGSPPVINVGLPRSVPRT